MTRDGLEELLNKRRLNEVEGNLLCNEHTEKESLEGRLRYQRSRVLGAKKVVIGAEALPFFFVTRAEMP